MMGVAMAFVGKKLELSVLKDYFQNPVQRKNLKKDV